jgi:hypothetical protein
MRRRSIFLFSLVPIMFPMCSHEVPHCSQVVPQNLACSTSFWFHMVCPKVKSLVYKVKRWPIGSLHLVLFCSWQSKELLRLGSAQCPKKIGDGPINMALPKNKK